MERMRSSHAMVFSSGDMSIHIEAMLCTLSNVEDLKAMLRTKVIHRNVIEG